MKTIDFFLFSLSPFTYFVDGRLSKIAAKYNCQIRYRPFALLDVFAQTGGTPPAQRHESRKKYRSQEIARIAKKLAMPITLVPKFWPTNPIPSCYAIINAQAFYDQHKKGDLEGLTRAILRSCWADEKDIADEVLINELLKANGFPSDIINKNAEYAADCYKENTNEAVRRNVFGAPSFLVDDQVFWGQDRLDYLDDYLAENS